jgi:DNA invertase Pin-like site-specific DNA recombinase
MARTGYVRVSKRDQHPEVQASRLRAAGCDRVYIDHGVSGKLARRPQWDACLASLRAGDTLVAVKLDRIGRSVAHLLEVGADLERRGVDLVCLDQPIDTTTAVGKLFFTLLAAFAQFERDLLIERTRDGLETARAKGNLGGRPNSLNPQQRHLVRRLHGEGQSVAAIARQMGTSRGTVYRTLEAPLRSALAAVPATGLRTALRQVPGPRSGRARKRALTDNLSPDLTQVTRPAADDAGDVTPADPGQLADPLAAPDCHLAARANGVIPPGPHCAPRTRNLTHIVSVAKGLSRFRGMPRVRERLGMA